MDYKIEYNRWCQYVSDNDTKAELEAMSDMMIEDAFYRNLSFGTGGLRGIIGAGTNRMNVYVVAKASQGLANYLGAGASVVIGYDSRIKSEFFAKTAASVFAANGILVHFWPQLLPVSTVSFATRKLKASAGVMITASHNPSKYNGYKVYGSDGCQITTEAAEDILSEIEKIDIFFDVKTTDFDKAVIDGLVKYIESDTFTSFIEVVKSQSVLFGDEANRDVDIVYTPLNGTGLVPVTRILEETGFTKITVVEEQKLPDGNFPTCPYPNPEILEAMDLGLSYCVKTGADILIATDPDADRCGIAVRTGNDYELLTGNEVGILLLDFICSQRIKHNHMPNNPLFVKTIVTMDLAEKIAEHYGVKTVNVLTGFKFIGEVIGRLQDKNDFIFGFEESYGYLTGSYVRDKDAVNASFMICEMFAFYKSRGKTLKEKLEDIYREYGYCYNTLHSYDFPGSTGMEKMNSIMSLFRDGIGTVAGMEIVNTEDYILGLYDLPSSDVMKYYFRGNSMNGSVVIRPSGTEPKLKVYISITASNRLLAEDVEKKVAIDIESHLLLPAKTNISLSQ